MNSHDKAILNKARKILSRTVKRGEVVDTPNKVRDYFLFDLSLRKREIFGLLLLDSQYRVITWKIVAEGGLNEAYVYPRELVKIALFYNAGAVILVHNHPSGNLIPSDKDINMTKRLQHAFGLIDVMVLDHIIVAGDSTLSMLEDGLL